MAYEDMTYPFLMNRMLDRSRESYPDLDYREGSLSFNGLAGAGQELAILYVGLDNVLAESFVPTSTRQYALLGCRQAGMDITQFEASASVHKGVFNIPVTIGSRWNLDIYNYVVTEQLPDDSENYPNLYVYRLECEQTGSAPNTIVGNLTPIDFESNELNVSQLVETLILGEDEATLEEIKEMYQTFVDNSVSDGNVAQYYQWCNEYAGIGASKVFSGWNGKNTVKVSILDSTNSVASEELIADFQEFLDPGSTGMGDGAAPIGAIVTVTTATEKEIDVSCSITFADGYDVSSALEVALQTYFYELAYTRTTVSYMGIGSVLLGVEGVDSINNLTINGGTADITLGAEEIPVLGETDWTVV